MVLYIETSWFYVELRAAVSSAGKRPLRTNGRLPCEVKSEAGGLRVKCLQSHVRILRCGTMANGCQD